MKIGIFGGTFNPPHNTHISIAKTAREQLCLDKLIVVPCGIPPHKRCDVDKADRLAMAKIAFKSLAEVSDYEINKDGKSYTANTLEYFSQLYKNAELYLIIGGDSLADFHKWYCPEKIVKYAALAVADRKNSGSISCAKETEEKFGAKIVFLDAEPNAVSSTEIRLRYRFGMDNGEYVPQSVDDYVRERGLYSQYRDMAVKLRNYISPERYRHTFYVVKRGLQLANDSEKDKAFTACLLHDCAKGMGQDCYAKYGYEKPPETPIPVVHSYLGAKVAMQDFGVVDEEILDAIRYHTTARPNMTRLDKIVYVADKTEETRPYIVENLLCKTLDETFVKCLVKANEYTRQRHGLNDDPLTQLALRFYLGE